MTTPEATLILDQRQTSFGSGFLSAFGADRDADGTGLLSSPTFEWAVVAAMSISAHLLERNYALRFIDETGAPAMTRSVSVSWPEDEEFQGQSGLHNISEGLAALELVPDPSKRSASAKARRTLRRQSTTTAANTQHAAPFGDPMLDKLAAYKNRGPLIAVVGVLTEIEARELAPAAEYGSHSFAMIVTERPRDSHAAMDILRAAGWHAVAVTANASLPSAWSYFDAPSGSITSSTAKTTFNGAVGARR